MERPAPSCSRLPELALSALALATGCGSAGEDADASAGDAPAETDDAQDLAAPIFIEPASGELMIPVTKSTPQVLSVADITPGLTRVVLNETSVGALAEADRLGTMTTSALTLNLRGAMVAGDHTLQLWTPGEAEGEDRLQSRAIAVAVRPSVIPAPVASVGTVAALQADAIFAVGYDGDGLLVALDLEATPPTATLMRGAGTGWNLGQPAVFELEGLDALEHYGPARRTVSADVFAAEQGPDDDRVRVAWRSDGSGGALMVSDSPWEDFRPVPRTVLSVEDVAGSAEYARFGRPLLLGSTVVAELLRAADVEQLLPGDHALVTVRFEGSPIRPGVAQVTHVAGQQNIEWLSPVIDPIGDESGDDLTFAARVGGTHPMIFTLERNTGVLDLAPTLADGRVTGLLDLAMPMTTVLGAFSSRQVFAALGGGASGPRVLLHHFDDSNPTGGRDASPLPGTLADLGEPTADPAATLLGGAPIYLVPLGPDAPAYAFVSTGPSPVVAPIEGLQCDEIAVPVATEANQGDAVQLACRRGRDVALGTLRLPE